MINNILEINEYVKSGRVEELINVCEQEHTDSIDKLYKSIVEKGSRVILVTGPSSSGKTSVSNLLSKKFEIPPLVLSIDDFWYGSDEIERSDDDIKLFESIAGVNVKLLNECIYSLLRYEPTNIPRFDFVTARNIKDHKVVTLRVNQEIILEGTHAFNEALMPELDHKEKFKVYAHVGTDMQLENGATISGRDIRLIRRSVRDQLYRGASIARTQTLWGNVVTHEKESIIPYMSAADGVFDSFLSYEPCVIKSYLDRFLSETEDTNYTKYIRSLNEKLKSFGNIDENLVPKESVLKEFLKR